jgi:proteasome accessory factor B
LLFDRSDWYLYAWDENREGMRIFALSRINGIVDTGKKFEIPHNFDYRSLEGISYFGVYKGEKVYHFAIEISGDIRFIKERLWAEDQTIKKTHKGAILSFTSNQFEKVLGWVLHMGSLARPLAPKALVDRWIVIVQDMAVIANSCK